MKSKITFLLLLLFSVFAKAQNADKMYDLLKDKTQTNILYDRVFGISNATEVSKAPISAMCFKQVYHEIQRADYLQRLPQFDYIKNEANLGFAQNQIPLSLLISEFESIKKESLADKSIFLNGNNQFEIKPNATVFEKHNLTIIAPLLSKTKSNTSEFILKDNLIFNTTNKTVSAISVNFNDGKGWKTLAPNQAIKVTFQKYGTQTIDFKIQLSDGEIILQQASFETENRGVSQTGKNNTQSINAVTSIAATIPYQGYGETAAFLGQGEYEIFMDTTNGVLDKPIFLLDGFDPGDSRNIANIYSLLNYGTTGQNLADDLRAQGFDVIILNFPEYTRPSTTTVIDGGVDYIQRNAMILVELINEINAQKVGTEKNVVIGPSMGGLIARYGLRYMEQHSMNPDTRLYISFDSPHLGANVPIGMQHLFNYMAYGPLGNTSIQPLVDGMLKSPAGREMLIDQFEGHLQSGSAYEFNTGTTTLLPTGCPNYRTAFQTELNTMGFPTTTRNIAIANGAGNGTMTGTPGMEVMNHTFNTSSTQRAIINLHFTPAANTQLEVSHFRGQQWVLFWITAYESLANSKSPTYTAGLDSAPGGRFDMSALASSLGTNALLTEFFNNLEIQYFDFIPVWSSMAISNTTNLYAPVTASSTTPFVASSIPTVNENHITLDAQNVAFALNEILNPLLSLNQNEVLNSVWIKNPVENTIQINSNYNIENASISVTDVLGKTIFSINNQNINGTLEIPVSLSNGVYLITIKNLNNSITKKLIKE